MNILTNEPYTEGVGVPQPE